MLFEQPLIDLEDLLLLALMRTSGNQHRSLLWNVQGPAQIFGASRSIERCERIELRVAGNPDSFQWSAEPKNPLGFFILPHQEEIDFFQRIGDQVEQRSIFADVIGRETSVDQHHPRAALFHCPNQVGPYLGIFKDEQIRPNRLGRTARRSEEHTSELQSRQYLVCRLLLETKNT